MVKNVNAFLIKDSKALFVSLLARTISYNMAVIMG